MRSQIAQTPVRPQVWMQAPALDNPPIVEKQAGNDDGTWFRSPQSFASSHLRAVIQGFSIIYIPHERSPRPVILNGTHLRGVKHQV